MNDKQKVLDKIAKCLALSKSANEHEAAAALRQAQKLMVAHALTEEDVGLVEYVSAMIITDYEWPSGKLKVVKSEEGEVTLKRDIAIPRIIGSVTALIRHTMGVSAVFEPHRKGSGYRDLMIRVRYFGPRSRVTMAIHAHEVIYRALARSWKRYLEEFPTMKGRPGARAGFYLGWCQSVFSKVHALVATPDEVEKTAKAQEKHYAEKQPDEAADNKQKVYGHSLEAGGEAGSEFDINRPIGTDRMRLGHGK